jgi:hypothetical protein
MRVGRCLQREVTVIDERPQFVGVRQVGEAPQNSAMSIAASQTDWLLT